MSGSPSSGRLLLITGPSGVGKGTLVARLLERHPGLWLSVSATTRAPRAGEEEGRHYFFLDRAAFERQVAAGGFLEWAEFAGNLYGTPRGAVQQRLDAGQPVLLEIELEGARQVRRSFPAGFQVLLQPPSFEELERRIRGRAPTVRRRSPGAWPGPARSWRRRRSSMRWWSTTIWIGPWRIWSAAVVWHRSRTEGRP